MITGRPIGYTTDLKYRRIHFKIILLNRPLTVAWYNKVVPDQLSSFISVTWVVLQIKVKDLMVNTLVTNKT
ncbi:MAG: hypothetical protein H9855_06605 [Candidatus Acinetobacter avistercoris]|nr:hypothetical protein [Candidatus Acinetobacter avistercoris]